MSLSSSTRAVSRRSVLGFALGIAAVPVLAACGQAAAPTATPAPAKPAEPAAAAKPTEAPKPAAAAPTNTAAAAAAAATKPAEATKPAAAAATKPAEATKPAAAAPATKATLNGNLVLIQERGFNPLQTTYMHDTIAKVAKDKGWPLDAAYQDSFTGGSNFFEKIAAAVSSGQGPDLMFSSQDTFQLWNQKSVQPADDVVQWAIQQFGDPAPLTKLGHNIQGKWYDVPYFTTTGGFWVRKSWFDATGWDISKQYSLQEWLDAALKVSDASKKHWGWGNTVNRSGDGQTNVGSPLWMSGARISTADNKLAINSEEAVLAFEWLKTLYSDPKYAAALPPGVNAWTDPSNNEAYLAGTIGFSSNAGTMFATAMQKAPEVAQDTWLAQHPTGPVGKKEALITAGPGAYMWQLMTGAKNLDAAKEMIQTMLSKENQKAVWDNSPGHSVPAYKWGWDEPELKKVPNNVIKVSQEIIQSDKAFKLFLPQADPKLWINAFDSQVVVTDIMADILKGTPVKDAVKTGTDKAQKIYDNFGGK